MRRKWVTAGFLGFLILWSGFFLTSAAKSLYGKVTAVRSADVVLFDYGTGQYVIRILGVEVPKEGPIAQQALEFVSKMVLGKNARIDRKSVV